MIHAPWTKEQAEQWAEEHASKINSEGSGFWKDARKDFLAGLAKAAEIIEASPTVYGHDGSLDWSFECNDAEFLELPDTHQAKLVGAKPIERKT